MAAGKTTTDSLADSLPVVIGQSRIVRELEKRGGMIMSRVDNQTLGRGNGMTWHEVSYARLTAQAISQTTELDNPQQLSDTDLAITPTMIGIQTLILDLVGERIVRHGVAKLGQLATNAMSRKKNVDGITAMDGFTTSLGGSGTLTYGHIVAAAVRIQSNTTEPGMPPFYADLHGFQIKDISDEFTSPVGTYDISRNSETFKVFRSGFKGMISNVSVHENGDIPISSNTSKGGVYAKEALILVQGFSPKAETRREPHIGGGATSMFHYDEYAYGERSSGNWGFEIQTDTTVPTS